jgi:MscS family membrane protein
VNADYFTAPVSLNEFNAIRQEINLLVLKLMEELKIELAGASTDIRVAGINTILGKQ